jgi:hypothetical protein
MMPTGSDHSCFGYEVLCIQFSRATLLIKLLPTLLMTNAAGSAHDYTDSTFPGCNYGTVSVPTTVDTIDEVKTLALPLELRLRVPLSTITMPLLWQRSLASATEGTDDSTLH